MALLLKTPLTTITLREEKVDCCAPVQWRQEAQKDEWEMTTFTVCLHVALSSREHKWFWMRTQWDKQSEPITETMLYWRNPHWAAMNWRHCLLPLTLTLFQCEAVCVYLAEIWLWAAVWVFVSLRPESFSVIRFGLCQVRSVKIYALAGNYYRPPSLCYSLNCRRFST